MSWGFYWVLHEHIDGFFSLRFFSTLTAYFVGGALFMKFGKGATGSDVIPNVQMWIQVPSDIKVSLAKITTNLPTSTWYIHTTRPFTLKGGMKFAIGKINSKSGYSSVWFYRLFN
jgi:hypothetical protein